MKGTRFPMMYPMKHGMITTDRFSARPVKFIVISASVMRFAPNMYNHIGINTFMFNMFVYSLNKVINQLLSLAYLLRIMLRILLQTSLN